MWCVCAHNTLLIPSTFNKADRPFHVWFGRIGLILGTVGFVSGTILTWFIYDYSMQTILVLKLALHRLVLLKW
jgi:hypothetical protein